MVYFFDHPVYVCACVVSVSYRSINIIKPPAGHSIRTNDKLCDIQYTVGLVIIDQGRHVVSPGQAIARRHAFMRLHIIQAYLLRVIR